MSAAHAHLLSIRLLAEIISASLRMHVKIHPLHPPQQEIIAGQVDTLPVCCVILASLPTQYAPLSGSRRQEKKEDKTLSCARHSSHSIRVTTLLLTTYPTNP